MSFACNTKSYSIEEFNYMHISVFRQLLKGFYFDIR